MQSKDPEPDSGWGRRTFLGAAMVGAGAVIGGLVRKFQNPDPGADLKPSGGRLDERFTYSTAEFEQTDPRLLLNQPSGQWETGLTRVRRIATTPSGEILVLGDRLLKRFTSAGRHIGSIQFDRPPHAVLPLDPGSVVVAMAGHYEIRELDGTLRSKSGDLGPNVFLTSIAVHQSTAYLADAGNRQVIRCNLDSGKILGTFGRIGDGSQTPGFVVPSPYFDLVAGTDDRLRIVNPGRLRVETYDLNGRFLSHWGGPGMQIEKFCGCCNPVFINQLPDGNLLTSEKGLARVKLYSREGNLLGVVAGHTTLVDDPVLAKKACEDCTVGAGFDIASGTDGRVYILDPFRKNVRFFAPATPG